jgi:hypothetical protein
MYATLAFCGTKSKPQITAGRLPIAKHYDVVSKRIGLCTKPAFTKSENYSPVIKRGQVNTAAQVHFQYAILRADYFEHNTNAVSGSNLE